MYMCARENGEKLVLGFGMHCMTMEYEAFLNYPVSGNLDSACGLSSEQELRRFQSLNRSLREQNSAPILIVVILRASSVIFKRRETLLQMLEHFFAVMANETKIAQTFRIARLIVPSRKVCSRFEPNRFWAPFAVSPLPLSTSGSRVAKEPTSS